MSGLVFTKLLGVGQGLLLLAWLRSPNQEGWMALHDSHRLVAVPDLTGWVRPCHFCLGRCCMAM